MTEPHPTDTDAEQIVIPALLRFARGSYGLSIRSALVDAGFDDIPPNGAYVLGGMANDGGSAADLIRTLGVSKQAASQLIDTLVVRGYLERSIDLDDRRRMTIDLTDRGRAAAAAIRTGVTSVDAELATKLDPANLAGLRAGLIALIEIRERLEALAGDAVVD
jgi:DNA-binding MarR family transcriptional regulator